MTALICLQWLFDVIRASYRQIDGTWFQFVLRAAKAWAWLLHDERSKRKGV